MPNIRAKRIGKRLAYRLSSGCGLLDKGQSPLELSRPVACLQLGGQAIVGESRSLTGNDMVSPATEVFPIVPHKTRQIQNRRHVDEKACFITFLRFLSMSLQVNSDSYLGLSYVNSRFPPRGG